MTPKRILVIDDDEDIRDVAQVSLETLGGWDVRTADGGADGLRQALEAVPDLILLDVMMPGMDGPTTLEQLRSNPSTSGIPVLFLTAKARTAEHERLLAKGADAVIAKPFDPLDLHARVVAALEVRPR